MNEDTQMTAGAQTAGATAGAGGSVSATKPAPSNQAEKPVLAMLGKYKMHIEDVLPKHITPQKFMKTIVTAINKTPQLLQCTPMSVINAVLTASQMGLEIGPGQSYLVPYGKECTLIIDYRGKIDLAIRSGKVLDIDLEIVYSREKFRIFRGESGIKQIEHEPMLYREENGEHFPITEKDRGVPIGAYAMAILREGPPKIVFMPALDIQKIRDRAKARDNGPWGTDTMEMWKKTICHRICKTLPHSAELQMAQDVDSRVEMAQGPLQIVEPDLEDEVPMLEAGQGSVGAAMATAEKTAGLRDELNKRTRAPYSRGAKSEESPVATPRTEKPERPSTADTTPAQAYKEGWDDRGGIASPPTILPSQELREELGRALEEQVPQERVPAPSTAQSAANTTSAPNVPETTRPPMPSTADVAWRKRTRETYSQYIAPHQYEQILKDLTGFRNEDGITVQNYKDVWAALQPFKDATEILQKQKLAERAFGGSGNAGPPDAPLPPEPGKLF